MYVYIHITAPCAGLPVHAALIVACACSCVCVCVFARGALVCVLQVVLRNVPVEKVVEKVRSSGATESGGGGRGGGGG
jgi:hypothetical protein